MDIEQVFARSGVRRRKSGDSLAATGASGAAFPRRREYAADSISCSPATFRDDERMLAMSMV